MTREDVKKLFPEATDEQITNLLNQNNSEVAKERKKLDDTKAEIGRLKEIADKAGELQSKLDEVEQGKLSELEKLTKALEKANGEIDDLKRSAEIKDRKAAAAEKFKISAEQANQVVKDDGSLDFDLLGQIMSEKETAAALAKEQEIANAAANPNGGKGNDGGSNNDGKTSAVKLAEKHFSGQQAANTDIISQYANGGK